MMHCSSTVVFIREEAVYLCVLCLGDDVKGRRRRRRREKKKVKIIEGREGRSFLCGRKDHSRGGRAGLP